MKVVSPVQFLRTVTLADSPIAFDSVRIVNGFSHMSVLEIQNLATLIAHSKIRPRMSSFGFPARLDLVILVALKLSFPCVLYFMPTEGARLVTGLVACEMIFSCS